ncbi:MAG: aldehyde dehydrogenase family protein, partial [Rhodanobacter sp.]
MTKLYQNYIDGQFVADSTDVVGVFNPATNSLLANIPDSDEAMVARAVEAARRAQPGWEKLPPIVRAGYLRQISAKLREHRLDLAGIIVREQGKTQQL